MCGRFTLSASEAEIMERFIVDESFMETRLSPRFNIAPTQTIAAIIASDGKRILKGLQWGLIPFWVKDLKAMRPMINARMETLAEKPFFKTALSRRRCIIPADGFYEWQVLPEAEEGERTSGKGGKSPRARAAKPSKQPVWIHLKERSLFGFAGLFDEWKKPDGTVLPTCTIITTSANQAIAPVHDRMPVILSPENEALWLNAEIKDTASLISVLDPYPSNLVTFHKVSPRVNSAARDEEGMNAPEVAPEVEPELPGLGD